MAIGFDTLQDDRGCRQGLHRSLVIICQTFRGGAEAFAAGPDPRATAADGLLVAWQRPQGGSRRRNGRLDRTPAVAPVRSASGSHPVSAKSGWAVNLLKFLQGTLQE